MPFYKWSFRSLRERTAAPAALVDGIGYLASAPVDSVPQELVESLCSLVAQVVRRLGWAQEDDDFLLTVAMEICRGIPDAYLASLPVDAGSYR